MLDDLSELPSESVDFSDYYRELAPLDTLLADDTVSEIMVNGPNRVYAEVAGKITKSHVRFNNDEALLRVIRLLGEKVGRQVSSAAPLLDARMLDGSRANAVLEPVSVGGATLTILKFSRYPLTASDMLASGTLSPAALGFLQAAVQSHLNIVILGAAGSGKTTLLNMLSGFIGDQERIVTIEDTAEMQLHQQHVVKLESRRKPQPGEETVEIRDLVINAMRMRPDRLIVGECRGGETLDMLQAMNTGHDGSMTTLHANSPRDAITRLETMALMSGMVLPLLSVRRQIVSAIHLLVQMGRLSDGSRRVVKIVELLGLHGEVVTTQDIFEFVPTATDANGHIQGELQPRALRPRLLVNMTEAGVAFPPAVAALWPEQYK